MLTICILSAVGQVFIITRSKLFKSLRDEFSFLHCPLCLGFWCGMISYLLYVFNIQVVNYAFIGSFMSYLAYLLLKSKMAQYD